MSIDLYVKADPWAREVFEAADYVVHAEVIELSDAHTARAKVLEDFKGNAAYVTMNGRKAQSTACGAAFKLGERYVFVVIKGEVSACGKHDASPTTIEAMRRLRSLMRPNNAAQSDARDEAARAAGRKR